MKTKKLVACFKNVNYQFDSVLGFDDMESMERFTSTGEYIRISEVLEIEFDMIDDADIIKKQVEAIDAAIEREKCECLARIESMQNKKAELLGLTYVAGDDNNG